MCLLPCISNTKGPPQRRGGHIPCFKGQIYPFSKYCIFSEHPLPKSRGELSGTILHLCLARDITTVLSLSRFYKVSRAVYARSNLNLLTHFSLFEQRILLCPIFQRCNNPTMNTFMYQPLTIFLITS